MIYADETGRESFCRRLCEKPMKLDFMRLVILLEVRPEQIEEMMLPAEQVSPTMTGEKDLETQRAEAIARCQRRIQAAVDLYGDGRLSREEFSPRLCPSGVWQFPWLTDRNLQQAVCSTGHFSSDASDARFHE
jgi:hypothetical protein